MTFDEMLSGIRTRNAKAQQEFVETYRSVVREAAPIRGRNPAVQGLADSEDLSQSVLFRAMENIETGLPVVDETHLERILKLMARRRRIDYGRAAQKRVKVIQVDSPADSPAYDNDNQSEIITELYRQLTTRQRDIFEKWAEGYTGHETADLLQLKAYIVFMERDAIGTKYQELKGAKKTAPSSSLPIESNP